MLLSSIGTEVGRSEPVAVLRLATELIVPLATVERRTIESAMILCEGNRRQAASKLGISITGLYNKLNAYRLADGEMKLPVLRTQKVKAAAVGA